MSDHPPIDPDDDFEPPIDPDDDLAPAMARRRTGALADDLDVDDDGAHDAERRSSATGDSGSHSAVTHKWVIRTAEADQIPTTTRLLTSYPLLMMYARRQVQLRYRQSVLGLSWTLVQPVAIMAIYGFIFTQFLQVDGGGDPYLSMAWSGLTIWMYVQATLQVGVVALLNDAYMLGRVWFPREIIPLAPVVAGFVDLAAAGSVLIVIVIVQGEGIGINWICLPLILVVLVVWTAAISVITATLNVFLRDLATIVGLGLRLLFIATPVMYPAKLVPKNLGWVNAGNPFAVIIDNVRAVMLGQDWPNWRLLTFHGVIGTLLLMAGLWYLRAVERRMVDVI